MPLNQVQYDARGNEFSGRMDHISGQTFTDARTSSATLGALNAESVIDLAGHETLAVHMFTAAASLTLVFEGTIDGTNYLPLPAVDTSTYAMVASIVYTTTANRVAYVSCAGYRRVRVRVSSFTSGSIVVASRATEASLPMQFSQPFGSTLWVTATAAANTAATATLPAVAGMFHYITHIDITRNATALLAGTATLIHTTTNLPGSPAWSVGNAMAAGGTERDVFIDFGVPMRSTTVNTATTVVAAAAGLAVLGRVNVAYYIGP